VIWFVASAHAQDVTGGASPDMNAQLFRPSVDGSRTLWVDDAARSAEGPLGRMLFHYTNNPLVYQQLGDGGQVTDTIGLLRNVMQADLVGGWSFDRARVGLVVPLYLFASGDSGNEVGLGDLALDGKVTVLDGDSPIDVALQGRLGFPTATVSLLPLGNPGVGWELAAVASKRFGPVLLAANLGTRGGPSVELENVSLNDSFVFRAGGGYDFTENAGAALEVVGALTYADALSNDANSPIEAMLTGWGRPAGDVVLRGGVGTGMTSGLGSPQLRLLVGVAYQPGGEVAPPPPKLPVDTDGDGLADEADTCPLDPEDADQFEDEDGCPDKDNDKDEILDVDDACRNEPEDKDAWKDEDGCPDPTTLLTATIVDEEGVQIDLAKGSLLGADAKVWTIESGRIEAEVPPGHYVVDAKAGTYDPNRGELDVVDGPPVSTKVVLIKQKNAKVVVTRDRIDLKDKIYFETASAKIKSQSFGLLDQAVQILQDYPEIALMRIEGHTDSRGSDTYNLKLSGDRAASVRQYFIDKGIDGARLTSQGFGETKPLDTANNEAAWSKNRRVDFFIEKWVDVLPTTPDAPAPAPEAPPAPAPGPAPTP
jgi:outer membrane protein OmpA-like peptidoglycan-associated protein